MENTAVNCPSQPVSSALEAGFKKDTALATALATDPLRHGLASAIFSRMSTIARAFRQLPGALSFAASFAVATVLAWVPSQAEGQMVYAAASLTSVLQEFSVRMAPDLRFSFASSSALARQIELGAPADVYISAHRQWMDYLQERALIDAPSRRVLMGNRLVVIVALDAHEVWSSLDFSATDFARSPFAGFDGRLAIADPAHVPAGMYARQALLALGWWPALEARLAPAPHVRAALVYVERGECPAGIVYATDAAISDRVRVAATIPDSLHAPIHYPMAAVTGRSSPAVEQLLALLQSPAAADLFRRHGFDPLIQSAAAATSATNDVLR